MNTNRELRRKLAKSKDYREEFAASQAKRGIPFQIRALMKHRGLSQEELASRARLSQGVVSRAADPNYGNLTLNTVARIAAGFDVAFLGRFVPFSELERWVAELSEESVNVPAFAEDRGFLERKGPARERAVRLVASADSARPDISIFGVALSYTQAKEVSRLLAENLKRIETGPIPEVRKPKPRKTGA